MPCQPILSDEAIALLRAHVAQHENQLQSAKALGVSPAYLSDVLKGRRDIGPGLAKALGLRKIVAYDRLGDCG